MSILFKRPLLLMGHSGISKSLALSLVKQSLMSVITKDELGLPRDHHYRIIKLDASTGITEKELEYIISKAKKSQK
jgi:serine kinase of HPr protein (carbohydrate metabolism regulator)